MIVAVHMTLAALIIQTLVVLHVEIVAEDFYNNKIKMMPALAHTTIQSSKYKNI